MTTTCSIFDSPETAAAFWQFVAHTAEGELNRDDLRDRLSPGESYAADLHVLGRIHNDPLSVKIDGALAVTPYEGLWFAKRQTAVRLLRWLLYAWPEATRGQLVHKMRRAFADEYHPPQLEAACDVEALLRELEHLERRPGKPVRRFDSKAQYSLGKSSFCLA